MLIAIGLGVIGLILIYFEFFVPGGILGTLGALFLVSGVVFCFWKQVDMIWGALYIFLLVIGLVLTIRLALWKIKKSQTSFYLKEDQEGYVASSYEGEIIGKSGKALTALRPSGHILIENKPYQAVSESGYIKKGTLIQVIRGEGARFIVRKKD